MKVPKCGKNMPAVKKLHQESGLNSKPDYFFGHSCQVIAVLLGRMKSIFAVPLISFEEVNLKEFLRDRIDYERSEGTRLLVRCYL